MGLAGSVQEVSVAGRTFAVAADADGQRKLGGFEVTEEPNGNGTSRKILNRVNWSLNGLTLDISDDNGDQEFLQKRANAARRETISFTFVSGAVYQGTGGPMGEINYSTASGTAAVDFGGGGELTKQ